MYYTVTDKNHVHSFVVEYLIQWTLWIEITSNNLQINQFLNCVFYKYSLQIEPQADVRKPDS